ncbi:LuxR C-terminal-related transcriptional regulator [Subtercola sp. RTI3]|nr:LuxR C-terminal-related transcriptional regulator [Subtercola sp. RTI3]
MTLVSTLAEELAGEFRLQPLLTKILVSAVRLLGCRSGSICTIDEAANLYRKEVDLDVHCQAGQVFSLDEGVTGAIKRTGDFVVFDRYSSVPGGHIPATDDRHSCPVIGVPLTHNSVLIGAFVVFGAARGRAFTEVDAEQLALFGTHASIAIVNSRAHSAALAAVFGEAGPAGPTIGAGRPPVALTTRERQVQSLVVRGLPDKQIAAELGISAKTVEKHVGTILRKSGAHNRTMLAAFLRSPALPGYGGNPA